jgi:hypothetical protein
MAKTVSYRKTSKSSGRGNSRNSEKNLVKWVMGLAVLLAIPVTILLNNASQDTRQRASYTMPYESWLKSSYALDYNKNGTTDIQDYNIWLTSYLPTSGPTTFPTSTVPVDSIACAQADLNKDGKVDAVDYNILLANKGKTGQSVIGDIDLNGVVDEFDYTILKRCMGLSGNTPTPSSDTTLPSILIYSPALYGRYSPYTQIKFDARASDASGIQKVELYIDGKLRKTCTTATCVMYTNASLGDHTFEVKAYDKANNMGNFTTEFSTTNDKLLKAPLRANKPVVLKHKTENVTATFTLDEVRKDKYAFVSITAPELGVSTGADLCPTNCGTSWDGDPIVMHSTNVYNNYGILSVEYSSNSWSVQ